MRVHCNILTIITIEIKLLIYVFNTINYKIKSLVILFFFLISKFKFLSYKGEIILSLYAIGFLKVNCIFNIRYHPSSKIIKIFFFLWVKKYLINDNLNIFKIVNLFRIKNTVEWFLKYVDFKRHFIINCNLFTHFSILHNWVYFVHRLHFDNFKYSLPSLIRFL